MENDTKTLVTHTEKEAAIFDALKALETAMHLPGAFTMPAFTEMARTTARVLETFASGDEPEECFRELVTDVACRGEVVGHFLMQCMGEMEWTVDYKKFLLDTAVVLGPDHLEALRRNVAFMIKVEGFN